jgi:GntR family transcriptional regulator of arabinose operon
MSNDNSEIKYKILADQIRKDIITGKYLAGEKMKSENELVKEYGYSRQTVRQALDILERSDLVTRRRGSGTYVKDFHEKAEKTYNIGIITTYITDYIFPYIISGIEKVLTPKGYHMLLSITKNRVEDESNVLNSLMEKKIDGLLVEATKSALPNPNLDIYRKMKAMGVPIVFFNSYYPDLNDFVKVATDDRQAGYDITSYLISRGAKKIGGAFKSDDIQGHMRYFGYSQAMMDRRIGFSDDDIYWYTTNEENRFGSPELHNYLANLFRNCDGIICFNEKIALEIENVLEEKGILIPSQMMIGSFDDSKLSELAKVKITTMAHPKEEEGSIAAQKLLNIIETGCEETTEMLPMTLVVKQSTK